MFCFGGGIVMGTVHGWIGDPPGNVWSSTGTRLALVPGRFVYDFLEMQSQVTSLLGTQVRIYPRAPAMFAGLSQLDLKRGRDPVPPFRTISQLPANATIEHVTQPLYVLENDVSVLDTLFAAYGAAIPQPGSPCGFYYHGSQHGSVILLGFDLWLWTRAQIIQNLDVFLQGVWGLSRNGVIPRPQSVSARRASRD